MRPKAISGVVFAMARPSRPASELEAVLAASQSISLGRLAKLVASRAISEANRDPIDDLAIALHELTIVMTPSPIEALANDPDIDTANLVRMERIRRFEARGCRHLPERQWAAEDAEILAKIATRLANRYRRMVRNNCS